MKSSIFNFPLFNLGFRVFFLMASFAALILIILWQQMTQGDISAPYFSGTYWHSHEMLLGYCVAVIAGFLLTAVSNWTGKTTLQGDKLAGLSLLWLYGRILPFYSGLLPDALIALVDFAFLPVLTFVIAKTLIQAKNYRNLIFVGLLLFLMLGNAMIHSQMLNHCENSAFIGIQLTLATILTMILVIAGRIFPFFAEKALKGVLILQNKTLDGLAIGSALIVFLAQLTNASEHFLAITALFAASLNAWRLMSWFVFRIWFVPMLWILYLGYGWIILGFIFTAFSAWKVILPSLALHAFTVGGIGVLTIGMMARVSLGHTGRTIKASNAMIVAFILINVAALFRVILPAVINSFSTVFVYLGLVSWLGAFGLFVLVYSPILINEREDT